MSDMGSLERRLRRMLGKKSEPDRDSRFPDINGMYYSDILDGIQSRRALDWYLEIGTRDGSSLAKLNCNFVSIDPEFVLSTNVFNKSRRMLFFQETSDDFFASGFLVRNEIKPDLAFIDGMHLFEYLLRDFMNCERNMKADGIITMHDICPFNYPMASRDISRLKESLPWTGDVWKVVMILQDYRPDLKVDVLSSRKTGLAAVTRLDPTNQTLADNYDKIIEKYTAMTLEDVGAENYYRRFELRDPSAFLSSL